MKKVPPAMNTQRSNTPDGAHIAWYSAGVGETVILIPGQAVTRHSWDPIVADLADRFRVVTFDYRGIGDSTDGSHPPETTRRLAEDVRHVLRDAEVTQAHVIGHPMGGRVAQWLAIDHPETVATLVLIATTGGDARGRSRTDDASADLRSGEPGRLARRFFIDEYLRANPDAIDVFIRKEGSAATRRRAYAASLSHDAWDRLEEISSPTLVVHGELDSITPPENGRLLTAAIPDAVFLEVPGGQHAPHIDHTWLRRRIIEHLIGTSR